MKRYRKPILVSWAIWFAAIATASLLPASMVATLTRIASDETMHAFMYCGLALFAGLLLESRWARAQSMIAIIGISMLLEAAQVYIPGRSAEASDVAWNVLGIMVGWMAAEGILHELSIRLRKAERHEIRSRRRPLSEV